MNPTDINKKSTNQSNSKIFSDSVSDIKPLNQDKIIPVKLNVDNHITHNQHKAEDAKYVDYLSDEFDPFNDDVERNNLNYFHSSIGKNQFKQFSSGPFNEQSKLDLHGLSKNQARIEIGHFIAFCQKQQYRQVLIIPGQGHGILRLALNGWLRQINTILAFAESPQQHGGRGVIRLLLKSAKY